MKIRSHACRGRDAFSLVDWVVGMGLVAVTVTALYTGMTFGLQRTMTTQEELRATQIILEKVEQVRLMTWDKINYLLDPDDAEDALDPFDPDDPHAAEDEPDPFTVPSSFSVPFKPGTTNANELTYTGTLAVAPLTLTEAYNTNLLQVTVALNWTSGGKTKTRQIRTYFSKYGLQNNVSK